MQDLFGSVRRSLVFRATADEEENNPPQSPSPFSGALVEKINSCIRKSRAFTKPSPSSSPIKMAAPIRWRKGELIGCGAFGRVYMGMNLDSGELLAVKQVLLASNCATKEKAQAHIMELEEEVKLLKNLSHPNIVRYLGTVREEETLNILLEFVPGGSISSLLGKFGPFPESVVRTYTKQLLLGLEYLHNHGIMHRDIKGANILVDNKGCIKLADFGASKQVAELATVSGAKSMKGTPYWMSPEVILQTGHSFSADIWSVGCTVIEMVTGKPPWSQQYKEVQALFYIGTTKSHPPIPEHLSADAKDFLLKCLQEEPNLRPTASELLKHPFVNAEHEGFSPAIRASFLESHNTPSPLTNVMGSGMSACDDSGDICNLGSLNCSISNPEKSINANHMWRKNDSDDGMCQMDNDYIFSSKAEAKDFKKEISDSLKFKSDENPEQEQTEVDTKIESEQPSLSEEDDELTESKIRAFLDEKALELKKLQTPLYEEYFNSLNNCSPSLAEGKRDETPPNYLKLPPKSRSPSRGPVGSPSTTASSRSPGSNGRRSSYTGKAGDQSPQDNASPHNDWRGLLIDAQRESGNQSFSEIERKWKEELDQELERKRREKMLQAGIGTKTSSPKERGLSRQREKTRFASPGK